MPTGRNKYQSREARARIREIFMREWDPIGVSDAPEAADEYDSYVAEAYVMLMDRRAAAEDLASYLFQIATQHMGLSATEDLARRSEQTAQTLVDMRPTFETH
jgi:hypothetical protein